MSLWIAITWLVLLAGCWLGWQLLRQNGRLLLRLEDLEKRLDALEFGEPSRPSGLPLGSPAPEFELPDLRGEPNTLAQFRGQPLLLIFFNPACGFCRELAPRLAALKSHIPNWKSGSDQSLVPSAPTDAEPLPLIISTGDLEANQQFFADQKLICPALLQKQMEVAEAYQANGTPSGYLVDADGKIASDLAIGADALMALAEVGDRGKQKPENDQHLITSAPAEGRDPSQNRFSNRSLARSRIKRDGLKAGTPAPAFHLPRLDGRGELSPSEFRGRRVLLVFSSPNCGPCSELAPKLEQFHRDRPEVAVLMISKGEPKENRAKVKEHGLTFPIVLQRGWEISRLYAMFATPVGYLIDEAGVIAQEVAVGADSILELMTRERG